jgi:hypothetical protein
MWLTFFDKGPFDRLRANGKTIVLLNTGDRLTCAGVRSAGECANLTNVGSALRQRKLKLWRLHHENVAREPLEHALGGAANEQPL